MAIQMRHRGRSRRALCADMSNERSIPVTAPLCPIQIRRNTAFVGLSSKNFFSAGILLPPIINTTRRYNLNGRRAHTSVAPPARSARSNRRSARTRRTHNL